MVIKIKSVIIFIVSLAVIGVTVVFSTKDKETPILARNTAFTKIENQAQLNSATATKETEREKIISTSTPMVQTKPSVQPKTETSQSATKIKASMLLNGVKYEADVPSDSSVYDLMNALKEQKKIDFKAINYAELGFFVDEINGIKNNPTGKNWIYYVNSKPAPVGISYYKLKNNDIVEWKYEKKSF